MEPQELLDFSTDFCCCGDDGAAEERPEEERSGAERTTTVSVLEASAPPSRPSSFSAVYVSMETINDEFKDCSMWMLACKRGWIVSMLACGVCTR